MSIENVLKYADLIVRLLPLIDTMVTFVETLFNRVNVSGNGDQKKAIVTKAINKLIPEIPEDVLSTVIDTTVDIKNESGEFKKNDTKSSITESAKVSIY